MSKSNHPGNEAEVVRTSDLSPILREQMDKHQSNHPLGNHRVIGQFGPKAEHDIYHTGAYDWMSHDTGVSVRVLYNIVNMKTKHTSVSLADQILSGLELSGLLGIEIEIIPNPRWTAERWHEYMEKRGCA